VSEERTIITVKVDSLTLHPDNARRGDVPAIMRSLERFGQVKPIIVQRSTGYVVAGNHVLEAARKLGWPDIRAMVLDVDDETARAYLIADNRTGDKATYDQGKLSDLLSGVLDLSGTGFSEADAEEAITGTAGEGWTPEAPEGSGDKVIDTSAAAYNPLRQIPLAVPVSELDHFTEQIAGLQRHWQTKTTVETIRRVVDIAFNALPKPEEGFVPKVGDTF
jgi:hypothetical protein